MKNKGIAKHEFITVIALALGVTCLLMTFILKGIDHQRINVMKRDASSFLRTVTTNIDAFRNPDAVYLGEAVQEEVMDEIKSPFSKDYCDDSESKVEIINGNAYVTLLCDSYLIDKAFIQDYDHIEIYKVNSWTSDKNVENAQSKTLYNCEVDGKELYSNYYEELYFLSRINKDFGTNFNKIEEVKDICKVTHKDFYRTKKLYN